MFALIGKPQFCRGQAEIDTLVEWQYIAMTNCLAMEVPVALDVLFKADDTAPRI